MENILLNSEQELMEEIFKLQGDQALFLNLDKNMCNDLRYINFKKEGLQNSVMSYINSTHEMANLINFEKFTERVAELTVADANLRDEILLKYVGEKAMRYLASPRSHHQFVIDTQNKVLVIQKNGSCTAQSHMGICTC
jgi:hypothetical protein